MFREVLEKTRVDVDGLPAGYVSGLRGEAAGLRGQTYAAMLRRPEVSIEELVPVLLPAMELLAELGVWVEALHGAGGTAKKQVLRSAQDDNSGGAGGAGGTAGAAGSAGSAEAGSTFGAALPAWVRNEMKTVETEIKFAGYLQQQKRSMERLKRDEGRVIPEWFDYAACSGLSREMVQKLGRVRPATLGQASRIQGVTPAAVSLVNCFIEIQGQRRSA